MGASPENEDSRGYMAVEGVAWLAFVPGHTLGIGSPFSARMVRVLGKRSTLR